MVEKTVEIRNKAGIHCRPSSVIMAEIDKFPGTEFKLISDNGTAGMHSILELLSLGLQQGDRVILQASGNDEENACTVIAALLETEFDFPQNQ